MSELLTIDKAEFQRMLNQAVIAGMLAMEGKKSIVRTEYTIKEVQSILGVCKATVYNLIDDGSLEKKKRGRKTTITLKSIRNYQNK